MAVPWAACMAAVAAFYGLPPDVLPAIARVEGGKPGTISQNRNGTQDLGVMQINTVWVPKVARAMKSTPTMARYSLTFNACFNVGVAGAILNSHRREAGGDLGRAVGNYHSRTPGLNEAYQRKVLGEAWERFGKPAAPRVDTRQAP